MSDTPPLIRAAGRLQSRSAGCVLSASATERHAWLFHVAGWSGGGVAAQQLRAAATQGAEKCLSHDGLASGSQYTQPFIRRLADLGRVEGHNIAIEWRWGRGSTEQFPKYAAEVLGLNVDVIVAANSPAGLAARNATKTIPIVIATMEDPVEQGFATSLAHPGGSITGLSLQDTFSRSSAFWTNWSFCAPTHSKITQKMTSLRGSFG